MFLRDLAQNKLIEERARMMELDRIAYAYIDNIKDPFTVFEVYNALITKEEFKKYTNKDRLFTSIRMRINILCGSGELVRVSDGAELLLISPSTHIIHKREYIKTKREDFASTYLKYSEETRRSFLPVVLKRCAEKLEVEEISKEHTMSILKDANELLHGLVNDTTKTLSEHDVTNIINTYGKIYEGFLKAYSEHFTSEPSLDDMLMSHVKYSYNDIFEKLEMLQNAIQFKNIKEIQRIVSKLIVLSDIQ